MAKINIDTGVKRLEVSVDNDRVHVLTINPHDVTFLERGHQIYIEALAKREEWKENKGFEPEVDENGMPLDITDGVTLIRETNQWFRDKIDYWLGEGTSQAVFGDVMYSDEKILVYSQLIEGVMREVEPERAALVSKYIPNVEKPKGKRRSRK